MGSIMYRYEKCRRKLMIPTDHPIRKDGSVVPNNNFFKSLQTFPWRREWVKATLRCIHRKEDISPPDQTIYSLKALTNIEVVGYKIDRGIKNLRFEDVYDEWTPMLTDSGSIHPVWNKEDCEFIRNILSSNQMMTDILQEIVSFSRQGFLFTYELLGFNHSDIDKVYHWSRVNDSIRAGGIDEPWMGFDSSNVIDDDQSESFLAASSVGNETPSI